MTRPSAERAARTKVPEYGTATPPMSAATSDLTVGALHARFASLSSSSAEGGGDNLAARFAACRAYHDFPFKNGNVDTVQSAQQSPKWVYIDNAKAASSSIRQVLDRQLHVSWFSWRRHEPKKGCLSGGRTTARCLSSDEANAAFVFSVVRNPLQKLLSGIEQLKAESARQPRSAFYRKRISLQALLESGQPFVNEHLLTNTHRLAVTTHDGSALPLHAVVQMEHLDDGAWAWLAQKLPVSSRQRKSLEQALGHRNVLHSSAATSRKRTNNATAAGLVAIVGSELAATEFCRRWSWDYICFGYMLPPECAAMPMSSLLREM